MKTITIELEPSKHYTLTIRHDCFGQPISLESNIRTIDVHNTYDTDLRDIYNGATNALEFLVLEHACAGIDVSSDAYIKGTRAAFESICNNYA